MEDLKKYFAFWEKRRGFVSHFDTWMRYWEGCATCACDHGCNGWILENSFKMHKLTRAVIENATPDQITEILFTEPNVIRHEYYENIGE